MQKRDNYMSESSFKCKSFCFKLFMFMICYVKSETGNKVVIMKL